MSIKIKKMKNMAVTFEPMINEKMLVCSSLAFVIVGEDLYMYLDYIDEAN